MLEHAPQIEARLVAMQRGLLSTRTNNVRTVKWVNRELSNLIADIPDEPPQPQPVPVPTPPNDSQPGHSGTLEDIGYIEAVDGQSIVLRDKLIRGIHCENDVRVPLVDLTNCHIITDASRYGMYLVADKVVLNHCTVDSEYYVARGSIGIWESDWCVFNGAHAWRVYDLTGGHSRHDVWNCERLMLGGGYAEEGPGRDATPEERAAFVFGPFSNFIFDRSTLNTRRPSDIYPATHHVMFRDCPKINGLSLWGGCHHIEILRCPTLNQSNVKLGKDVDGQQRITWANAYMRGIRIA